jgi:hypothetical protein
VIICQEHRLGFIHIPKAAGSSIRRSLLENLPHCHYEPVFSFHRFGVEIRDWILGREGFERLRWFAVTRHPVESIWSSYQRTMQIAKAGNLDRFKKPYRTYLETTLACRDFEEYARTKWIADNDVGIKRGGFWHTYCCDWDGTPLPVRVLRFDNLAADWRALVREWELPDMELGRVNSSGVAFERGMVSGRIYDEIMDYCWRDCERFGYGW